MRTRRGLHTVVGAVIFTAVMISALAYVSYSLDLIGNFSETVIVEDTRQRDKDAESFEITSVGITSSNKLNATIKNTGNIPVAIKTLWIDQQGQADDVKKFVIDKTLAPSGVLSVGPDLGFTMSSSAGYDMKLVTQRGNAKTFFVNSPAQAPLFIKAHTIPSVVSTEFDTVVLMTVTNNATNAATVFNLQPTSTPTIDTSSCTGSCTATYVSGPDPLSYPIIRPGDTATFKWVYTVAGADTNKVTFTTALTNGVSGNTANAVVEVREVVSATESGTAITALGTSATPLNKDVLMFHLETSKTPSSSYQMYSGTPDGGNNGLKIDLDSATPAFYTQNHTQVISIPAGNWVSSLRLQSEAMPSTLKSEGESMIFHFNANEVNPDNSEGSANRDLEGCGQTTMPPIRITSNSNNAEEIVSSGNVDTTSGDLEMPYDGTTLQVVGLRFPGVTVPQGSIIQSAYIVFTADETQSGTTTVRIRGEAADNAAAFADGLGTFSVSNRADTTAAVTWSNIPAWTLGEVGPDTTTPEIKTVIQEIVNRAGWASGNALVITVDNSGTSSGNRRTAESDSATLGAQLNIVYSPNVGVGGPPTWEATSGPHTSGVFRFDGTNDCLRSKNNVASGDANNLDAEPDTTALWFKTAAAVGATEQHLASWEGGGTCPSCDYYKIALEANTGKVLFQFNTNLGADITTCKSANEYDDGNWYHVVAVREGTGTADQCSLYITRLDGTDAESPVTQDNTYGTDSVDADGRWYIGSNAAENGNFFNGWIDDVIHWNGKALTNTPEANDLSHTNYGTAAHKLNLSINKTNQNGVLITTLTNNLNLNVPFYDPKGLDDNADSTYGVFNYTNALSSVVVSVNERIKFGAQYVPETSTYKPLELDFKIDDQDITPKSSLLQIPPPDIPFPSYYVYDNDNRFAINVYNVGPYGSWFVYQGTRAVFDKPTGTISYAGVVCSVNSTEVDPCSTAAANSAWRVMEDRDSIFIPVNNVGRIYFWSIQDRPDRDLTGGTLIPPGEYDVYIFIDGYDERGDKFLRNIQLGRVTVIE
ncbi:MAG: LamG domain-containing protein [Candidatus Nitrosotenuis sp.]